MCVGGSSANLSQVIVMILCVMRGPDSTSRAQSNSRPQAIKFFVHFNQMTAQATSFQSYTTTCMVWIEVSTLIYTVYQNFKSANELLCSRSCCLFDRSVAKHDRSEYNYYCNCCTRYSRVPVVKLIDLVCGFLVQPHQHLYSQLYKHRLEIARDLDSVACPCKWSK